MYILYKEYQRKFNNILIIIMVQTILRVFGWFRFHYDKKNKVFNFYLNNSYKNYIFFIIKVSLFTQLIGKSINRQITPSNISYGVAAQYQFWNKSLSLPKLKSYYICVRYPLDILQLHFRHFLISFQIYYTYIYSLPCSNRYVCKEELE